MKITEVVINAGRTIPHPTESYANLRPGIVLKAQLEDGDDLDVVTKQLQAKAEGIIDDHARHLCESIRDKEYADRRDRELSNLEREIQLKQQHLEQLRSATPKQLAEAGPIQTELVD